MDEGERTVDEALTIMLRGLGAGTHTPEELLPLVYDQLRAIARRRMRHERAGHTLQVTALVHEAFMRLVSGAGLDWESRRHFYRVVAESMRRILIDHARKRASRKRGGGAGRVELDHVDVADSTDPVQLLAVDEALNRLEAEDARAAEVVRLRFFAGLEVDEVADVMQVSPRTVAREWVFARARLQQLLGDGEGGTGRQND